MSLLATFQKQRVSDAKKLFSIDVYAKVWAEISDLHKRWLLRGVFLQEEPEIKSWGGYSREEKEKIRACALFMDEFAKHQQLIRQQAVAKQKRINATD